MKKNGDITFCNNELSFKNTFSYLTNCLHINVSFFKKNIVCLFVCFFNYLIFNSLGLHSSDVTFVVKVGPEDIFWREERSTEVGPRNR